MIFKRKSIFFTSDLHIGHAKSIEFDERPFDDLFDMHQTLINNFNSTVPEDGICYFLGDMGNKTSELKEFMSQLNGTKVLIWGNHDKGISTAYNCGFDVVLHSASFFIGEERVTMSHCPLRGLWREDTSHINGSEHENFHGETKKPHQKAIINDEGQFHLHGHTHIRKGRGSKILGRQYDVGVCGNNYRPVSISTIESWVAKTLRNENNGK